MGPAQLAVAEAEGPEQLQSAQVRLDSVVSESVSIINRSELESIRIAEGFPKLNGPHGRSPLTTTEQADLKLLNGRKTIGRAFC